jgi:hypothetical protein
MTRVSFFAVSALFVVFTCLNQAALFARNPYNCTYWTSTEWTDPTILSEGIKYELLSEHEEDCATESKKGVCICRVTMQARKKYHFEGTVNAGWFGLAAGYEDEMTAAAEDYKPLEASKDGECVGPMWGYLKWNFKQMAKVRITSGTKAFYCTPCSSNSVVSTLLDTPRVTCSSKEYKKYDPPRKEGDDICK